MRSNKTTRKSVTNKSEMDKNNFDNMAGAGSIVLFVIIVFGALMSNFW